MFDNKALVIGCGSIGKRHIFNLLAKGFTVHAYDKKKINKNEIKNKKFFFYNSIKQLKIKNYKNSLIIISTWGNSHLKYFKKFCKKSKYFLIEKPLCCSVQEADEFLRLKIKYNAKIVLHHRWEFDDTEKKIIDLLKQKKEKAHKIIVHGGASCLVTNGIHFLNLACNIFNGEPKTVYAQMKNSQLNPRSKKIGYWDGNIIYKFKNNKELILSNSNKNSFRDLVTIYSPRFKIIIDGYNLKYFFNYQNKKITNLIYANKFKNIKLSKNYFNKMLNCILKENKEYNFYKKTKVIKSKLAALLSSKLKKEIYIGENNKKIFYKKKWPIS